MRKHLPSIRLNKAQKYIIFEIYIILTFLRMKQPLSFCLVVLMILIGNTVNHLWNKHYHCSQRKIEAVTSKVFGFWFLAWGKWIKTWKNMTFWSHYHVVQNKIHWPQTSTGICFINLILIRIYLGKVYHLQVHYCFGSLITEYNNSASGNQAHLWFEKPMWFR